MKDDGELRIGTKLDTSGFEEGVKELKDEADKLDEEITEKVTKSGSKLGGILGNFSEKFLNRLERKISRTSKVAGTMVGVIGEIGLGLLKIGAKIGGFIGVSGMIFGIVTAIFILIKALGKANLNLDQIKANFGYVGFVASKIFENLLTPAINKTAKGLENMSNKVNGLAGGLYKVIVYIGYILSKWTGRDLFEGASAEDYAKHMKEAQKSAQGTAKETKQIKKDLMGFDEVNKLSDQTSTTGGGGTSTSSITLPNLPSVNDVLKDMPQWVENIANNKDKIVDICKWLLLLFGFNKVISWIEPIGGFFKTLFGGGTTGSSGGGGLLSVLGKIGLIAAGIGVIIKANNTARQQMKETAETVDKLNASGTKSTKEFAQSTSDIVELDKERARKQKEVNGLLSDAVWYGSNDLKWTKLNKDAKKQYVKTLNENVLQQHIILQREMELYRQGKLTDEQKKQLIEKLKNQQGIIDNITDGYDEIGEDYGDMIHYQNIYNGYIKEMGGEISQFAVVERDTVGMLMDGADTAQKIEKSLGASVVEAGALAATKLPDKEMIIKFKTETGDLNKSYVKLAQGLAKIMSVPLNAMGLGSVATNIKKSFSNILGIKLAKGGIINNPGRGVALGSNIIGGEAGREAVIPLDDTTMNKLGEAIARHMNVNLTNVTEMNGRTISRELKKISNESNFSYNG